MPARRKLSFDLIRITAVCMVVMIHVSAYVVTYFDPETNNAAFLVGNLLNGLARAGTPMFMMLSGALLLDEKKAFDTRKFYRKSLLNILLLLVFWLFFYAAWRAVLMPLISGKPADMVLFRDYLLKLKGRFPHLWYLFMLVGAYLLIPVLRLFVKAENRPYILGLILISAVAQFGTQTAGVFTRGADFTLGDFMTKFHLEYATGYVPYLLIGWYLATFPPQGKVRLALIGAGIASLVLIILVVRLCIPSIPDIRNYMVEMNTLPAMVYGAGLFTLISALAGERETKSGTVSMLSRASFGVYILHVFFLDWLLYLMPFAAFNEQHPFLYMLVLFVLTGGLSLGATLLLSKIRGVRGLVRA